MFWALAPIEQMKGQKDMKGQADKQIENIMHRTFEIILPLLFTNRSLNDKYTRTAVILFYKIDFVLSTMRFSLYSLLFASIMFRVTVVEMERMDGMEEKENR